MKRPAKTDFYVMVSDDHCSAEVVFRPTASHYSFMLLHPSVWSGHGLLSQDYHVRHALTGDTGPYDDGDVVAMARYLADRALRKANGAVAVRQPV